MKLANVKDFLYWEVLNRLKGKNVDVVCCYLMHEDKLLIQTAQRNNFIHTNDTQYVVPGGKVDMGEKEFQAVHREMREETNLNVDILKKLGNVRNNQYELHCYLCVPMDVSQMRVMEPNKQKELKWVSLDEPINWTPANKTAFDRFSPVLKNYRQYIRG